MATLTLCLFVLLWGSKFSQVQKQTLHCGPIISITPGTGWDPNRRAGEESPVALCWALHCMHWPATSGENKKERKWLVNRLSTVCCVSMLTLHNIHSSHRVEVRGKSARLKKRRTKQQSEMLLINNVAPKVIASDFQCLTVEFVRKFISRTQALQLTFSWL